MKLSALYEPKLFKRAVWEVGKALSKELMKVVFPNLSSVVLLSHSSSSASGGG